MRLVVGTALPGPAFANGKHCHSLFTRISLQSALCRLKILEKYTREMATGVQRDFQDPDVE
jgi:hypothetical protein